MTQYLLAGRNADLIKALRQCSRCRGWFVVEFNFGDGPECGGHRSLHHWLGEIVFNGRSRVEHVLEWMPTQLTN